jgi:hypothetical protein
MQPQDKNMAIKHFGGNKHKKWRMHIVNRASFNAIDSGYMCKCIERYFYKRSTLKNRHDKNEIDAKEFNDRQLETGICCFKVYS